jgi:hypothetical protein
MSRARSALKRITGTGLSRRTRNLILKVDGEHSDFSKGNLVLPLKAADLLAWQIRRHVAYEQPKGEPPSEILYSFLGHFGVSCNMKGEYLSDLVQALNNDLSLDEQDLILKADCQFFLPDKPPGLTTTM